MLYALMLVASLFVSSPIAGTTVKAEYPSMVRVTMMGPDEKTHKIAEQGHGSGVIVGPHTIYTAKHVGDIKKGYSLKVFDQSGKQYTVTRIALDPKNDFATLTIKETIAIKAAAIECRPVETLDHLYVVGYPLDFPALIFEVVAVDYLPKDNTTILAATGVSLPGDSGGPVFNRNGEVVGLLTGEYVAGGGPFNMNETDLNIIVPMTETACKAVA